MSDQATNTPVVASAPVAKSETAKSSAPKAPKMKLGQNFRSPMKADEVAKRDFTVLPNKRVKAEFTFRLSESDKNRYAAESIFDFSTCSDDEILLLAATTVRIGIQARLRNMGNGALQQDALAKVNVKADYIDAQRQQVDEDVKAVRLLSKKIGCSEDTAREIIARETAKHAAKA